MHQRKRNDFSDGLLKSSSVYPDTVSELRNGAKLLLKPSTSPPPPPIALATGRSLVENIVISSDDPKSHNRAARSSKPASPWPSRKNLSTIILFIGFCIVFGVIFLLQANTIGEASYHEHLPGFFAGKLSRNSLSVSHNMVPNTRSNQDNGKENPDIPVDVTDNGGSFFPPGGYVDGEKRLKKHLSKLLTRQKAGTDLDVPIRSRWSDVVANGEETMYDTAESTDGSDHFTLYKNILPTEKRKVFNSPLPFEKAKVILKPTIGSHRPDMDAVFVFAEGYDLPIYSLFIESLRVDAKFQGDIVLSVSHLSKLAKGVEHYLRSFKSGVIVYTVDWKCFSKKDGSSIKSANAGLSDCAINGMYGLLDESGKINQVEDPREPRPVATARYELYWAWSLQYHPHQMILLIDARDTYFQAEPFKNLVRSRKSSTGGVLHLFEENFESTNIQKSSFNRNWITQAYGVNTAEKIGKVPVICSGSTIGEQIAIESYLRAMVAQFDKTRCKSKGCDQGFHNALYYKKELEGLSGIDTIYTHKQGWSSVNNLGAMEPTKSVEEWELLNTNKQIINWDKSITPVVHQFDRFKPLANMMNSRKRALVKTIMEKV